MILNRLNMIQQCVNSRNSVLEWTTFGIDHRGSGGMSPVAIPSHMPDVITVSALRFIIKNLGSIRRSVGLAVVSWLVFVS